MLFFNIARRNARSTLRVPEILSPNDWMNAKLAIDCLVLLLYFFIIISIGLRMGRKEENLEDFALGGARIPWWAVLASLIAAETSAGTFFGTPGEGFTQRNYTYLQLALGTIIARILVSYIFIKPYYDYKVFSIYEYLTARFGVGDEERSLRRISFYAIARVRRAFVCRSYRARSRLRNDPRRPADPNGNALDLYRRHRRHCHSDRDLHHAWRNQSRHLDGSHSGFNHDRQRADRARVALFAIPGGWHSIVQRHGAFHFPISSPPVSIRRNMAGTNGKECLQSSTPFLPA